MTISTFLQYAFVSTLLATASTTLQSATITTAIEHACAIALSGEAWCWGQDNSGALGNGSGAGSSASPIPIDSSGLGGRRVTSIDAGANNFTCALDSEGDAWCWGSNFHGQLGNPSNNIFEQSPAHVYMDDVHSEGRHFVSLSAGFSHACALDDIGGAWCWGDDSSGELGNNSLLENQLLPRRTSTQLLPAGRHFETISTGESHTCAVDNAGDAWCWGWNEYGQLGTGAVTIQEPIPTAVSMPTGIDFVSITAGGSNSCAIDQSGLAWCWGEPKYGMFESAKGGLQPLVTPVKLAMDSMPAGSAFSRIQMGSYHACGLTKSMELWCWGEDDAGYLGNDELQIHTDLPVKIAGSFQDVESFDLGRYSTCIVRRLGEVHCWGEGHEGQLGLGEFGYSADPLKVAGLTAAAIAAGGGGHTCVIETLAPGNKVLCWGNNDSGQLGNGQAGDSAIPVQVSLQNLPPGSQLVKLAAGKDHTCALDDAGKAWCWGSGTAIGDGTDQKTGVPVGVDSSSLPQGTTFTSISAGGAHSCAISAAGEVWCWGLNVDDQLGDGSTIGFSVVPVRAQLPPGVAAARVSAAWKHTCAIAQGSGTVYCWGDNGFGQLGQNDRVDRDLPTALPFVGNVQFTSISAGDAYTCATQNISGDTEKSQLWCWGENSRGQLGNGSHDDALSPSAIMVTDGSGATALPEYLATGGVHTCARTSLFGVVACWGDNDDGELANGTRTDSSTPKATLFGATIATVAGLRHTCAIGTDHSVYCAGSRNSGALGDGKLDQRSVPVQIPAFQALSNGIFFDRFEGD